MTNVATDEASVFTISDISRTLMARDEHGVSMKAQTQLSRASSYSLRRTTVTQEGNRVYRLW